MYEGNAVDLQMEKVIATDAILDDETHHCQVFRYDMEEDYILTIKGGRSDSNLAGCKVSVLYFYKDRAFVLHRRGTGAIPV